MKCTEGVGNPEVTLDTVDLLPHRDLAALATNKANGIDTPVGTTTMYVANTLGQSLVLSAAREATSPTTHILIQAQ